MMANGDKALVAHFTPICDRLLMLPFTIHCSRPVLAAEFREPQDILNNRCSPGNGRGEESPDSTGQGGG